ncbi:MAG: SET domain-containing protein-lysine N-methyltransferase [Candidatus Peribacteraceae bacterium]|nr:SET domain-containing protein-lysine N-methyltransferase [Candidatus Peribacteraceae bacterium]
MFTLSIGPTSRKGRGVFTTVEIPKDHCIMEFTGPLLSRDQLPFPYSSVLDHYTQIGENLYYQGPSGNLDDIINHSCNPNCGLREVNGKLLCFAIRQIRAGQELSWDYSTMQNSGWWDMECKCGSMLCRGKIGDFKDLPPHIQQKYLRLGIVPQYIARHYAPAPLSPFPLPELVPVRSLRSRKMHRTMAMA